MPELVYWEKLTDHLAKITLNSPDNLNALTWAMGEAFAQAVHTIKSDPAIRAVIVSGAGRAFSSGGDFGFIKANCERDPSENERLMVQFYNQFLCVTSLPIPTLALLSGPAVGAGLCLALACDLRLSVENTKLGVNFVRIGLSPGMGSTFFLPRVVGKSRAAELLYSGRLIDGREAKEIGLVHAVYPDIDSLTQATESWAKTITTNAPLALAGTKRLLGNDLVELQATLHREAKEQALVFKSADIREGIAASLEKRPPHFVGK